MPFRRNDWAGVFQKEGQRSTAAAGARARARVTERTGAVGGGGFEVRCMHATKQGSAGSAADVRTKGVCVLCCVVSVRGRQGQCPGTGCGCAWCRVLVCCDAAEKRGEAQRRDADGRSRTQEGKEGVGDGCDTKTSRQATDWTRRKNKKTQVQIGKTTEGARKGNKKSVGRPAR